MCLGTECICGFLSIYADMVIIRRKGVYINAGN